MGPERRDGLAAQGARDGRRPRGARQRRGRGRLGSRRDEPRARRGARAREPGPRALRSAVRRLRRRRALGGSRRAPAAADGLAGCRADVAERQGDREAPDRVRLRPDRGAAPRGGRRLGRDQRAALPVAEGDHGREVEAARDRSRPPTSASRPTRSARPARRPRCWRCSDPPPRGDSRKIEDDGTGAQQILDFLAGEEAASDGDPRLPRAPRRRAPEGRARRARQGRLARRRRTA